VDGQEPGEVQPRSLEISAISKDALDERKHSSCPTQQLKGTVTVLNISGRHDDAHQEAHPTQELPDRL
jgi:hypothetical protein